MTIGVYGGPSGVRNMGCRISIYAVYPPLNTLGSKNFPQISSISPRNAVGIFFQNLPKAKKSGVEHHEVMIFREKHGQILKNVLTLEYIGAKSQMHIFWPFGALEHPHKNFLKNFFLPNKKHLRWKILEFFGKKSVKLKKWQF